MNKKVILILVDGMLPDAITACGNEFSTGFISGRLYYGNAQTVMPTVTLPAHMSLFHSVPPGRHGVTTNTYTPPVRPIRGLFEVLKGNEKRCASFYNWEQLRDLSVPEMLDRAFYCKNDSNEDIDTLLTEEAVSYIKARKPDFVFLYLGNTDAVGHDYGFMTEKYLRTVNTAWNCIKTMFEEFSRDYTLLVTADHGGHESVHGTDCPEDMTIPIVIDIKPEARVKEEASIMDIAPTITKIMEIKPDADWRGSSLI